MPKNYKATSVRAIAANLTVALGRNVTSKCVRVWKANGYPLDDIEALEKRIKNQERAPAKIAPDGCEPIEQLPIPEKIETDHEQIERELRDMQRQLVAADNYEDARTLRVKIAGVRDVIKSLREQGFYVTKESQLRAGMAVGLAIKAMIMKIPSDVPQMLLGVEYAESVLKCEDYAFALLASLSDSTEVLK